MNELPLPPKTYSREAEYNYENLMKFENGEMDLELTHQALNATL
jgi:hypothetical protein